MERRKPNNRRNNRQSVSPEKRKGEDRRNGSDRRFMDRAMEIERRR